VGVHYRDGEEPDDEQFAHALRDVVAALDGAGLSYLLMGGVGAQTFARPRGTDDIDVFVRSEDAQRVRDVLGDAGFDTEETDPTWLSKAWKHGVLVDIISRSKGDIYLDDEVMTRASTCVFKGITVPVISPEDLLVIKAIAAAEHSAHHWYDALALVSRATLDWDYVERRALKAGPRRVLSLLLYAESNDLAVPAQVVESLFTAVHPVRAGS
jgi:predicted nucleotidyltransferase